MAKTETNPHYIIWFGHHPNLCFIKSNYHFPLQSKKTKIQGAYLLAILCVFSVLHELVSRLQRKITQSEFGNSCIDDKSLKNSFLPPKVNIHKVETSEIKVICFTFFT